MSNHIPKGVNYGNCSSDACLMCLWGVCSFLCLPNMWLVLSSLPDMVGSGCEHNGVIYRNGQSFKPSCKYQCVCVNGAIGCVTLCPESQPPRVWCQTPRRVKVPGQCCEQWICDEPKRGRKTAPRHAVEGRTPWELGGGSILCCLVKFFTHLL